MQKFDEALLTAVEPMIMEAEELELVLTSSKASLLLFEGSEVSRHPFEDL
jgi:hypothetical protein